MGCDTNPAPYRYRKKKVVAALKTEDHNYLEAFTKYTNTHDKVGKPLLKIPTPMLSCTGWGSIPSESVWSRATTWSGQVPLYHGQQTHQQIIVIYRIWVTNTASKQCCFTVLCIQHCSTVAMYWNISMWMVVTRQCGWLVPSETYNPVAPDNLCDKDVKLHVAKHVDAGRQDYFVLQCVAVSW